VMGRGQWWGYSSRRRVHGEWRQLALHLVRKQTQAHLVTSVRLYTTTHSTSRARFNTTQHRALKISSTVTDPYVRTENKIRQNTDRKYRRVEDKYAEIHFARSEQLWSTAWSRYVFCRLFNETTRRSSKSTSMLVSTCGLAGNAT